MRSLGGSIGLAVGVIVFNSKVRNSSPLSQALTVDEMVALLKSPLTIATFTPQQQVLVSEVFADAFTQEMKVATYIAAASLLVSLLTWQRNPPQRVDERAPLAETKARESGKLDC